MKKKEYIVFLILLTAIMAFSQEDEHHPDSFAVPVKVMNGDTLPEILLKEIIIFPPLESQNQEDLIHYRKLIRNLKVVYPYARFANTKLKKINQHLSTLKTEVEKKRYLDIMEKQMKAEFEEELKSLTLSQGKLLIKLIDRETGETTYDLVKDLKGSLSAFLYQSIARLFGSTLKSEYDPINNSEDRLIEEIIQRIDNGQL